MFIRLTRVIVVICMASFPPLSLVQCTPTSSDQLINFGSHHDKIINRHFPQIPKVWTEKPKPTQCSLGWARKSIPTKYNTTLASCEDATHQNSLCDQGSCHMGQPDQRPDEKPLSKFLFFTGCEKTKDAVSGREPAKKYTVFPRTYEVDSCCGRLVIVAQGFAAEDEGRSEESYICSWTDPLEQNYQRVWCNNCTDVAWQ
ncbi:hypothetical protein PSHT_07078 [Puccinia striiformis]|uniref:Secreted protein n=1 Tax=Puccinia striiformis TaxID=27350 RepID=A0A2S4W0Z8_9BASI|nr:hypothetical protein PSHT_07078 [Puccinia striiformis]